MKIILLTSVEHLGSEGDIKDVAQGYARNFLFPRKLAVPATPQMVARKKQWLEDMEQKKLLQRKDWEALIAKLQGATLTLTKKTTTKDQLYAAVTAEEISEVLAAEKGIALDSTLFSIKNPIKSIGTFEVPIKFTPDLQTTITIVVKAIETKSEKPSPKKTSSKKTTTKKAKSSTDKETQS